MASIKDYCRSALRVSVAQICQNLGWNATQSSTLELLTDVLERYLQEVGKVSHCYCEQFGRTEPNLDDLGLAFRHLGINLGELEDYVRHVDPVPFAHEVVAFPAPKTNNLQFPNPNSREILHHRDEHVHPHLPYMFPGMEDEVQASLEITESPTLGSQPPTLDGSPMDITSAPGEKRAAASADGLPPSKRPRMMASNLPEEAQHSQYEMTSVTMSNGFLTPTRGKGRLPDARTPPPAIRHALTFADTPVGSSKPVDGSEANKENNAVALSKEPTMRVIVTAGKESSIIVSSHEASSGDAGSKLEGDKPKVKKKTKDGIKAKKLKKKAEKSSVIVGDVIVSSGSSVVTHNDRNTTAKRDKAPSAPAKKTKLAKEGKVKKLKEGKLGKLGKIKIKNVERKKQPVSLSPSQTDDAGGESRLKELLLAPDRLSLFMNTDHPGTSADDSLSISKAKRSPSPESSQNLRQAFQPTDIFESPYSRENSPGQLVIAEAEGQKQEQEEEKQARLRSIDESISSVIRDSLFVMEQQDREAGSSAAPSSTNRPSTVERKKKKQKDKLKIKSREFISDDVMMKEEADDMTSRSEKSMNDTIAAVIRRGMEDVAHSQEAAVTVKTEDTPLDLSVPAKKAAKKEGKKKKLDKDKSPVKKKLKDKLKTKPGKGEEPPMEQKPFVSDKYSSEELRIYEFGESPPGSPHEIPARRPSMAMASPSPPRPPPAPTSVTPEQAVPSPADVKPLVINPVYSMDSSVHKVAKSPTPETTVAASSASTSSTASVDQPPIKPLKIEIPKEKERHKERDKSRDKERKKDKKRDKEKKKKNKDKDRDRDRSRDKHRHHHEGRTKEDKPAIVEKPGFRLKIKLGNSSGTGSSVTVTENKASPAETAVKQEPVASPSRKELKLVIKCGDEKRTSRVTKSEPPDSPPVLKREVTPPPPVLQPSAPFSSPRRKRSPSPSHSSPFASPADRPIKKSPSTRFTFETGGRSPAKSPVSPVHEPFSSPVSSPSHRRQSRSPPVRRRQSHSTPPRTPSPARRSPSPMPKTPSPMRHRVPSSPSFMSSPMQRSPSYGHKSPTPTPKTPSLSPAYPAPSSVHSDHSPARDKSPPSVIKPLFGTPERDTSPPPSPLFAEPVDDDDVKPEHKPPQPAGSSFLSSSTAKKPKRKVGRPRSKSPRAASPRAKSPKGPKSPKTAVPKAGKSPKVRTGKSPGRPPKAKTLAAKAAAAAAKEDAPPPKPKPKVSPPKMAVGKSQSADEESPPPSPAAKESQPAMLDRSSRSPSPPSPGTSRGQGTVEVETVGFFLDAHGQKIWICPSCKMQDDGSAMIGCDTCDDWYHWVCVNITQEPPEDEQWYCPRCKAKARNKPNPKQFKPKAKRGRKKKVP